ncbi:hypothetical protein ES332_D03G104200v1 [Gossypium tomentosum]|uniref:GS catalytic domain-containing protein n=1 Tax=Gossypium tomentosum TaxID=34277 RepID=A0A5D2LLC1_GOSTO|nr:hypothetical protein ES332_D03G104200v1 [Gossypium tomentosum]
MAESIARGVVQSGVLPPQRISTAIHSNPSHGTAFQSLGISVYSHNTDVVDASDVIIFSVKPQMHAEAGNGQYEMALGYTACTYATDNLIFMREVDRAIANKHGLLATFVPKYALDDIGSGSHVHLSLWQNGQNVFQASDASSQHGMSKVGEEFMAGVLDHLPSIFAFTAPLSNSYDRIQPNTWSGAYQCWGKENREAHCIFFYPAMCIVIDGFN